MTLRGTSSYALLRNFIQYLRCENGVYQHQIYCWMNYSGMNWFDKGVMKIVEISCRSRGYLKVSTQGWTPKSFERLPHCPTYQRRRLRPVPKLGFNVLSFSVRTHHSRECGLCTSSPATTETAVRTYDSRRSSLRRDTRNTRSLRKTRASYCVQYT